MYLPEPPETGERALNAIVGSAVAVVVIVVAKLSRVGLDLRVAVVAVSLRSERTVAVGIRIKHEPLSDGALVSSDRHSRVARSDEQLVLPHCCPGWRRPRTAVCGSIGTRHDGFVGGNLAYLKLKSTFNWSLSNLVALIRQQLFVYRDLMGWLNDPFQAPPALAGVHDGELALEFAR